MKSQILQTEMLSKIQDTQLRHTEVLTEIQNVQKDLLKRINDLQSASAADVHYANVSSTLEYLSVCYIFFFSVNS